MKSFASVLTSIAVFITFSACSRKTTTEQWMQEETGIRLPEISEITTSTGHEAYKTLHGKIRKDRIETFTSEFAYSASKPRNFQKIDSSGLPFSYVGMRDLVYAHGASDYTAWDSVICLVTGDIWLAVECPDQSGDLPHRALKSK